MTRCNECVGPKEQGGIPQRKQRGPEREGGLPRLQVSASACPGRASPWERGAGASPALSLPPGKMDGGRHAGELSPQSIMNNLLLSKPIRKMKGIVRARSHHLKGFKTASEANREGSPEAQGAADLTCSDAGVCVHASRACHSGTRPRCPARTASRGSKIHGIIARRRPQATPLPACPLYYVGARVRDSERKQVTFVLMIHFI